ncbi:hypothetical protein STEG23_026663 [Scotinomys teguina]
MACLLSVSCRIESPLALPLWFLELKPVSGTPEILCPRGTQTELLTKDPRGDPSPLLAPPTRPPDYYDVLGSSAGFEKLFDCVSMEPSGDFMASGPDQLTLCSQSLGFFGTPAAPVQWVAPGDSDVGDFMASGPDQLTLCSQSLGFFGTPAAPVQWVAPGDSDVGDFMASGPDQLTLCSQSLGFFGTPAAPVQWVAPGDSDVGDFMASGPDQLTLCSQSLGFFGTPAAPVQGKPPG